MNKARFAIAIALVCVACVKVSDDVKATFAPAQPSEVDNFSPRSPHSIAPPDPVFTQAALSVDASKDASAPIGMCTREVNASSSLDAGTSLTSQPNDGSQASTNCLQDAGNP